jgi:hypothetical protein
MFIGRTPSHFTWFGVKIIFNESHVRVYARNAEDVPTLL